MSNIQIRDLSFGYGDRLIFNHINAQLDSSWKLGCIGRNGLGKTTLLKLLAGQYEYQGEIIHQQEMEYFPFEVKDQDQFGLEVVQAFVPWVETWQIQKEISLLELEEDVLYRPFSSLSNGEQTKLLLATLFLKEDRFYLIDEPTNHLDQEGRKAIGSYLAKKKGFILVSHDRQLLDQVVDHVFVIQNSGVEIQQGNFSSWWENKRRQDAFELAQNEKYQKQIQQFQASAKQASGWSDEVEKSKNGVRNSGSKVDKGYVGHKAAKMMKRAKNQERLANQAIQEKRGLLKDVDEIEPLKMQILPYEKDVLATFEDVSFAYGDKQVLKHVNLCIKQHDCIAIQGNNGSGKSTLLKLLIQMEKPQEGRIQVSNNLKISYVSQSAGHLTGSLKDYAQVHKIDESLFKAILRKLGFSRLQLEKDMDQFSQGQKKKVLLARSLCEPAHLFVYDEPLNYIDVISRMQIEEVFLMYQPTMIFVEHDAMFQEKIATKVIHL